MKALPVLGPDDWVISAKKKLDYALAHMYASDASQTALFPGLVASMSKQVKDNQGDLDKARAGIEDMISTYLQRYFNKVEISVYKYDTDDFHRGELVLSATVTDENGDTASLHEIMTDKGSIVRTFIDYQNPESLYE